PDKEAQMRELSRLPDTVQRVEVLKTIAEEGGDGKLTATRLREEIDRHLDAVEPERETVLSPSQRVRNAAALVDQLEAAIASGDGPSTPSAGTEGGARNGWKRLSGQDRD